VPSGSPVSLVLGNASLTQPDGSTATFTDVVFLAIKNNGAAVLTVGGGTNAMTSIGTITVAAGATAIVACPTATGYALTASTADVIKFTSASGTLAVDVMIAGHG
jgi:hypothetical protein